jgi:hypothetical protein
MEYIESAFLRTNGKIAKALVLFLSKERHAEKTRPEILAYLKINRPSLVVECKFREKPVDRQAVEYFAQKVQDLSTESNQRGNRDDGVKAPGWCRPFSLLITGDVV